MLDRLVGTSTVLGAAYHHDTGVIKGGGANQNTPNRIQDLIKVLCDEDADPFDHLENIQEIEVQGLFKALIKALGDDNLSIRRDALRAIDTLTSTIIIMTSTKEVPAELLKALPEAELFKALIKTSGDDNLRHDALRTIVMLAREIKEIPKVELAESLKVLTKALFDKESEGVRQNASSAIGRIVQKSEIPEEELLKLFEALTKALDDKNESVRCNALYTIDYIFDKAISTVFKKEPKLIQALTEAIKRETDSIALNSYIPSLLKKIERLPTLCN